MLTKARQGHPIWGFVEEPEHKEDPPSLNVEATRVLYLSLLLPFTDWDIEDQKGDVLCAPSVGEPWENQMQTWVSDPPVY